MACISSSIQSVEYNIEIQCEYVQHLSVDIQNLFKNEDVSITYILSPYNIKDEINSYNLDLNITNISSNPVDISVSVVCTIPGGVPLYAKDGSLLTFEGFPIYVRKAELKDYE